jgi:hypothetical protein
MNDLRTVTYKGLDRVARLPYAVLVAILGFGIACLLTAGVFGLVDLGINPIDIAASGLNWIAQLLVGLWGFIVEQVNSL